MHEIKLPKHTVQWRGISAGDIDVYVPLNAPIKTTSQGFIFGQVKSGNKALGAGEWVLASVEGNKANDGDDSDDTRDGDMDGTTSSGGIDSTRVNEALLLEVVSICIKVKEHKIMTY